MLKLTLKRCYTSDQGTFGFIHLPYQTLYTGELPERDNQPNLSCIEKGQYLCTWTKSPVFKKYTYELVGVPGRSGIRIHSANFMGDASKGWRKQLNGCIALSEKIGMMGNQQALLVSKPAIRALEEYTEKEDFILEII